MEALDSAVDDEMLGTLPEVVAPLLVAGSVLDEVLARGREEEEVEKERGREEEEDEEGRNL